MLVYNSIGQKVLMMSERNVGTVFDQSFDISELSPGQYSLQIIQGQQMGIKQLVVQ